ncbi:MAG: hypothetical protein ABWX96_00005 [Propionibacteriaceae bacterium]
MSATVLHTARPAPAGAWVDAAPFRAHLKHLMAVSHLSSSAVAMLAGVSPRLAYRLLHGHGGRPLRRVSPDIARKLLQVTAAEARAVRVRPVPAARTRTNLRKLQAAGWSLPDLALAVGLPESQIEELLSRRERSCTQQVALRAAAEVSLLLLPLPREGRSERHAA